MLVYTSEPMIEPLTFAGNAEAKLHVSTDTPDADWAVKLIDVHPDGFAQNIARGILRGRYRNSLLKPELMQPGNVYGAKRGDRTLGLKKQIPSSAPPGRARGKT